MAGLKSLRAAWSRKLGTKPSCSRKSLDYPFSLPKTSSSSFGAFANIPPNPDHHQRRWPATPRFAPRYALCIFDDRGLGNGFLLPAGPLRETWPRQLDVGVTQIKVHTGRIAFEDSLAAHRQLAGFAVNGRGEQRDLRLWAGQAVDALAAIAQPQAFFSALQSAGLTLSKTQAFPDHDPLLGWQPEHGRDVLCTEKDAVKLWPRHPQVWGGALGM
jgi:tetraacyldisaccharide-1-P 4'-kinase